MFSTVVCILNLDAKISCKLLLIFVFVRDSRLHNDIAVDG